jgi:hypothetical protein
MRLLADNLFCINKLFAELGGSNMSRGLGGRSPANIANFLEGINFPASKDELVNHAEDNNAPQEVIDVLDQLPDQEYTSMADVMSGIGQVE